MVFEPPASPTRPLSPGPTLLSRATLMIEDRAHDPELRIGDLASAHGVSRRHLEQVFAGAGTTPAQYLRDVRMNRARDYLLALPEHRIVDVGRWVGYRSATSFVRAFRQLHGVAPSAWRAAAVASRSPRAGDDRRDPFLDAALACVLDLGLRHTTLTDVARRAGVPRMTIYREWPDMSALLADLMTREWGSLAAGRVAEAGATTPASIADTVVATVWALRQNELFTRIVELDPEWLLPYLLAQRGESQDLIIEVLSAAIRTGQANGTVRAGAPQVIARALLLAAHGFVLSAHTMVDESADETAFDVELHTLVIRSLQR